MVSHDCVAFYLLSAEVSKSVKVVQSGQGADEILAGYSWYPPLANIAREQTTEAYAKVFFDRSHDDVLSIFAPEYGIDADVSREFATAHQGAPGADTAVDAALRLDTQVMLVDDPVKRVDTMTMAWGLEARVPFLDHDFVELAATCPPELKLASGGKGVLKDASRATTSGGGDRPDQGPLPGAGHPPSARRAARHGARRIDQRRGPDPRAVSRRGRQSPAGRAERDADHAGLQRVVATGGARDVAAEHGGLRRWGSRCARLYGASLSPDATAFAHLIDDGGYPRAVQRFLRGRRASSSRDVELPVEGPVSRVIHSADGQWLACEVAPERGHPQPDLGRHHRSRRPDGLAHRRRRGRDRRADRLGRHPGGGDPDR